MEAQGNCLRDCTDAGDAGEVDELADNLSNVVSLASDMSAYTNRSTAAGSTQVTGSSASTIGGRRGKRQEKKRGKLRQGTPAEEQNLCKLVCELAPLPSLCTQVRL